MRHAAAGERRRRRWRRPPRWRRVMAASSSRTRPRSTASQPSSATSASSVRPVGVADLPRRQRPAVDSTSSSPVDSTPTRGRRVSEHLRDADARQHPEVAGGEHLARGSNTASPALQVVARHPHRLARGDPAPDGHRWRRRPAARCARPSRWRRRRRASARRSRCASPRPAAAPGRRVAGGHLGHHGQHDGPPRRHPRCRPPARRSRPWRCWRTAARPPARSRPPRPARSRPPRSCGSATGVERGDPRQHVATGRRRAGSAHADPRTPTVSRCPARDVAG